MKKTGPSLIVPIQAQALCVGEAESEQKGACFMPPTADFPAAMPSQDAPGPFISGPSLHGPFETGTSFGKGVHLHWFLPDALVRARSETDGDDHDETLFPVVPNRWLVTRMLYQKVSAQGAVGRSRSWVVESDFLSTDVRYATSANIPFSDPATPYRYMGRAIPLEVWPDDAKAAAPVERFAPLTALGYGEPSFAIYYPNCRNVFGFHDPLETDAELIDGDPRSRRLTYTIVGWYAKPEEDPVSKASQAGHLAALLKAFNWSRTSDPDDGLPARTLCCGMITNVHWHPQGEYIERDLEAAIGLGNTVADGLSALLAAMTGHDAGSPAENLLGALQTGHLKEGGGVDALADWTRTIHKNTFASESGGALWCILAQADGQDVSARMAPRILADLDALNRVQARYNTLFHETASRRKQTFLDWYKYMVFRYDQHTRQDLEGKGIDAQRFEAFLAPDQAPDNKLADLQDEIDRLRTILENEIEGTGCELGDKAAPRYYRPNDPVILLAGKDLQPTLAHAPGQILPCVCESRLLSAAALSDDLGLPSDLLPLPQHHGLPQGMQRLLHELHFLDSGNVAAAAAGALHLESAADREELQTRLEQVLKTQSAFHMAAVGTDISPAAVAVNPWVRPWNPLFMHWRAEYKPVASVNTDDGRRLFPADLITSRFELAEDTIDLRETQSNPQKSESYEGITILTPNAINRFEELAAGFVAESGGHPAVSEALEQLRRTPVLAQALSGFHDALIMKRKQMQFPLEDPLDAERRDFNERLRRFVGAYNRHAPTPENYFNPVRAGRLRISAIRTVDTFGQGREIQPQNVFAAQDLPVPSGARSEVFLPPRLAQPARLAMRWLGVVERSATMGDYAASSPCCGWIVPNFLDASLMIFDAQGGPAGILRASDKKGTLFRSYPGSEAVFTIRSSGEAAAGVDQQIAAVLPHNPGLQHLVTTILEKDASYLEALVQTLDRGLGHVAPDGGPAASLSALLCGRPMALLRIGLKIELKGLAAVNQRWESLVDDMRRGLETDRVRDHAGFTAIKFPVRLGSPKASNEYNDGLIGFFQEGAAGGKPYSGDFYSYHSDGSHGAIPTPTETTLEVTADPQTPPVTLLVLMDPRAKLHATCGILPKKGLEIPAGYYEPFFRTMDATFLTSPVLHHREVLSEKGQSGIDLPLTGQGENEWLWIAKDGAAWQESKIFSRKVKVPSSSALIISEGWLKLKRKDGQTE